MLQTITSHHFTDLKVPRGGKLLAVALLACFTSLIPCAANVSANQDEQEIRLLEPGKAIERNLVGGQTHTYRLSLEADQYLHLVVTQKSVDVVLRLFSPGNSNLAEVDISFGTGGAEIIKLMTKEAGSFRLEVRSQAKNNAAGSYEVKIEELRNATARDTHRIAAHQLYLKGEPLRVQGTDEAWRKAVPIYEEMLTLARAGGDVAQEAGALHFLLIAHRDLGESRRALDYFNWRILLFRAAGDRRQEAEALADICYYYKELGEYQKSLDGLNQLLALNRSMSDREGEAQTLATTGLIYSDVSEHQKALDFNDQALQLSREIKFRGGEALALANLGLAYIRMGEPREALDFYGRALPIFQEVDAKHNVAFSLHNIGAAYQKAGEHQKALDYFNQVLPLFRDMRYRLGEASALHHIGTSYDTLGDSQKALDHFDRALVIFRTMGDGRGEATVLTKLGGVRKNAGELQSALDHFNQALKLFLTIGDRSGEAATLYRIARIERELGRLDAARPRLEAALEIIESVRARIVSGELRASYFATVQDYYELYVELLMQLHRRRPAEGYDAAALQTNERARARTLLELLNESGADIRQGVDSSLLERERHLRQLLNAKAQFQTRLLSGSHLRAQADEAAKEIAALAIEYEQVQAQIRSKSPRYAALTQPRPSNLKEIQRDVLDANTLLLEFSLGAERSYLWAVTPTSFDSFELPKRAHIEARVRRVYELLTARNKRIAGETGNERRLRVLQADAAYKQAASELSAMLLGPVATRLGNKRLLIVGDGALQYLPFAALPSPSTTQQRRDARPPLIVNHEVVSLPSASTLAVLRREMKGRQSAPKMVAVIADPVFAPDDERVSGLDKRSTTASAMKPRPVAAGFVPADVLRAMEDTSETNLAPHLPRLTATRREAREIASLVAPRERLVALDFAANRATVTSPELSDYRTVHFATHAFINSVHPELSGIVLSLVDEKGQTRDGFLRAHEIFNLKLPADLVVLSACRTGLGKEVKGEGLIGMTRGFMYAGTPRVVVSLWALSDKPTAELMTRFYQKMLGAERLTPVAALRAAQVEMWKDKRWEAAYFWGAFTLQGEWR